MNNSVPKNLTILITRPLESAKNLAKEIKMLGATPIIFPTLEIVFNQDEETLKGIRSFHQFDLIIFNSQFAVYAFFASMNKMDGSFANIKWGAIGQGTVNALKKAGIVEVFSPKVAPFESETLLQHPILHSVVGKSILLVQGQQGRQLLKETLITRKALVTVIEVYHRAFPKSYAWLDIQKIDMILVTSRMGLDNLIQMMKEKVHDILEISLLVTNVRLFEYASSRGFKKIVLAKGADNMSVIQAFIIWAKD